MKSSTIRSLVSYSEHQVHRNPNRLFKGSYIVISICLLMLTGGGCALGPRMIDVDYPRPRGSNLEVGSLTLASVKDERVFEQNEKRPDEPSFNGYLRGASVAEINSVVGRFWNPVNGEGEWNIILKSPHTTTSVVQTLVVDAFRAKGVGVGGSGSPRGEVAVVVEKFWSWLVNGTWAAEMKSIVQIKLTIRSPSGVEEFTVQGVGSRKVQVASEGNWTDVFGLAIRDLLANLDEELSDFRL